MRIRKVATVTSDAAKSEAHEVALSIPYGGAEPWPLGQVTVPAGKNVSFTLHQDGNVTYYFW